MFIKVQNGISSESKHYEKVKRRKIGMQSIYLSINHTIHQWGSIIVLLVKHYAMVFMAEKKKKCMIVECTSEILNKSELVWVIQIFLETFHCRGVTMYSNRIRS